MRKKSETAGTAAGGIDWTEVNRVLDFMSQHNLEEFEYAAGDLRVHLRRPGTPTHVVSYSTPSAAAPALSAPAAANAPVPPAAATPAMAPEPEAAEEGLHAVKSPIVGTFYGAPNPNAPPFAKVGDRVSVGQVLCIVEAMKLMNEIESDVAGELVRVLVENGQPVEYGQALFAIRTAKS